MSLSFILRRALSFHKQLNPASTFIVPATERGLRPAAFASLASRFHFSTEAAPAEGAAPADGTSEKPGEVVDPSKIRGRVVEKIPVETSVRYLQSKGTAYSITYGTDPVWKNYRRNFKGSIPPKKTRKRCIRAGKIATGSPCPICRDDYLVLSPNNIGLLEQFISPHTGETLSYKVTGICQEKHKELLSAVDIAKDKGALVFDVPFRSYDYSEYKK